MHGDGGRLFSQSRELSGSRSQAKKEAGDVRSRTQPVARPNSREIEGDGDRLSCVFFRAKSLAFLPFSGDKDGRGLTSISRASNRYLD